MALDVQAHDVDAWTGPPDYQGIEILSPMVRASTLPLRLSCLQYGAGLVYSGVTIDQKIIDSARIQNEAFGCIDYISRKDKHVIFSTCSEERSRVIFQIGTADSCLATQAALSVCNDVRGIDVNMGCTAPFSTIGGRGSVLLEKPEVAADILKSLRRELPSTCSVSCKIRMLPTQARTRDFMQLCERSGAGAIAVHLRTVEEEACRKQPAHWDELVHLCDAVRIPAIANGDFLSRRHIDEFWTGLRGSSLSVGSSDEAGSGDKLTGPAAIMIARGALWNPGIFHGAEADAPSYEDVVRGYIRTSVRVNSPFENTKWVLTEMVKNRSPACGFAGASGKAFRQLKQRCENARCLTELCELFGEQYDSQAYPPSSHTVEFGDRALAQWDALCHARHEHEIQIPSVAVC